MPSRLPVYAHRLGGQYGPESSPAALDRTLSQPVDGLEADVVLTTDDQVVVLHDPELSLSTDLEGWAHDIPADKLLEARILDRSGEPSDQRPMLLTELLERIPSTMPLELDVKAYVDQELVRRTAEKACDIVHGHGTPGRAEIASFFTVGCVAARSRDVAARLIVWGDYAPQALGRWAIEHGIQGVAFEGFIFARAARGHDRLRPHGAGGRGQLSRSARAAPSPRPRHHRQRPPTRGRRGAGSHGSAPGLGGRPLRRSSPPCLGLTSA